MKYSEAIRLGAMLGPQCFGMEADRDGGLCANGGATRAAGYYAVYQFGAITKTLANCPVCGRRGELATIVAEELNDHHRWTRERIANWVETKERELEQAAEPELVTVAARE